MFRVVLTVICGGLLATSVHAEQTVKVFILAGQSNMQGHGKIKAEPRANEGKGSLEWLVKNGTTADQFKALVKKDGSWSERSDVQIWYLERKGNLRPGYGHREGFIGPELGFGHVVGDAIEEPVLLIKLAWGGKSLAKDFRPPSAGGEVGPYYKDLLKLTRDVMKNADTLFPQYQNHKLELVGLGWHQGWNDRVNQSYNDAYEENMANFIRDIRKDLGVPKLPVVIAETGMSGHKEKHPRAVSLMKAQADVAKRKEFQGNVAFVGTKDYFRTQENSPSGQAYHWNNNAETYWLIGTGMGNAMLKLAGLHKQKQAPPAFPGEAKNWHGFDRYDFQVDGKPVLVVTPEVVAKGRPWVWHGEFFGHKPAPDIELLKRGFHIVYMQVPDMLGSPNAVAHWNEFYKVLTKQYGFADQAALVGLSRGGLYCYNWAAANPTKVACIYGDAPVCDFKSWPGGQGTGKGSSRDWKLVLEQFDFKNDAAALAYQKNPVDNLAPLAAEKIPLLHVYGDADEVVPWKENTGLIAERYPKLGGSITLISKPGVGHHPHGLEDPSPIVEFIVKHASVR